MITTTNERGEKDQIWSNDHTNPIKVYDIKSFKLSKLDKIKK